MKDVLNKLAETGAAVLGKPAAPATAPATEQKVLATLRQLERDGKPTHGPAIARASNGTVSVHAVYTLLDRLAARGLVERNDVEVLVGDITVKRVCYSARPQAVPT